MKKLIFLLVILCLCFAGAVSAEDCKYGDGDLEFVDEIIIEAETGEPANGLWCTHFKSLYNEIPLKNGKWEGIVRNYYESDKLKAETPFKNDRQEGIVKRYYESGKLKAEIPYKNGKLEGFEREYYESGKLWRETPYKNGKLEGIARYYYESGKLKDESPYKNDKLEGIGRVYKENGRLWGKIIYRNDKVVSGTCANGRAFTNAEIINWQNGHEVICD